MNPLDNDMQTTWVGLKNGIFESRRKLASPMFQERGEVLRNNQDQSMPPGELSSGSEYPTGRTAQGEKGDNDLVDMHAKYVLRTRLTWTGLYGKAPWPRVQKQWEKI